MDSSVNHSQWIRVRMRVMQIRGAFIGGESGFPSLAVGAVSCMCNVRGSPFSSSCLADGALLPVAPFSIVGQRVHQPGCGGSKVDAVVG
jgi:hypothetical protein